ncbi:hypothetical protein N7493_005802 [Penicillium malachiteum]|uniref:Uncharacterized protein n=1 Tax=Penicillium malachiteum TaxID=1324776 RepID=A0AAD6HND7_9EURO|nr:hypothetical protein N7493_005802 [Penicillium malachiteum]
MVSPSPHSISSYSALRSSDHMDNRLFHPKLYQQCYYAWHYDYLCHLLCQRCPLKRHSHTPDILLCQQASSLVELRAVLMSIYLKKGEGNFGPWGIFDWIFSTTVGHSTIEFNSDEFEEKVMQALESSKQKIREGTLRRRTLSAEAQFHC